MYTRRQFLRLGGLSLLTAASAGTYAFSRDETLVLKVEKVEIQIQNLPADLNNFRIGFLTDLHLGIFIPDELIEKAVQTLNQHEIDLLLLGGDYLWMPNNSIWEIEYFIRNQRYTKTSGNELAAQLFHAVADHLKKVQAPAGRFGVMGNHDRWINPKACGESFAKVGIDVLINRSVEIKRGDAFITLVGVDDYWTGIPRLPPHRQRVSNEVRILLAHNPDFVAFALEELSYNFELTLCGHTHGGQIKLPILGTPHYNINDTRFRSGLVKHPAGQVYTSRGIGVVEIPLRINCPPEATILTLKQA